MFNEKSINVKKVKGGVSKEYIVKNDKNIKKNNSLDVTFI